MSNDGSENPFLSRGSGSAILMCNCFLLQDIEAKKEPNRIASYTKKKAVFRRGKVLLRFLFNVAHRGSFNNIQKVMLHTGWVSLLPAILKMETIQESYGFVGCFLSFHGENAFNYLRVDWFCSLGSEMLPFCFCFQRLLFQLEFLTTRRHAYQMFVLFVSHATCCTKITGC